MKTEPPHTRSRLLQNCFFEVGIGLVAVFVLFTLRGGWRLIRAPFGNIDFWIECGSIGAVVLAAAVVLAVRDYRAGVKKIRSREEEELWGRPHDDTAARQQGEG